MPKQMARREVLGVMSAIMLIAGQVLAAEPGTVNRITPVDTSSSENSFEERRAGLLDMLTSPESFGGDIDSGGYSYRRRWQYYNACLARGTNLPEANRYFARSDEIVADEWPVLLYLRTYFALKDTVLSKAARKRLAEVMLDYKKNSHRSRYIERYGTGGNHSIVNFSMYLLLDQEFGNGPKHDVVRDRFINWVQYQGKYGRDEVNSPHYLDRSLLPLLNVYDFIDDPKLKLWAQMAIDQMVADFAVLSVENVRGGPWCRAHHGHSAGVAEINDGTQDTFYVAGHQFFGRTFTPIYLCTDQILNYGFLLTTSYRPPDAVVDIAHEKANSGFQYKSHRRSVNSAPSPGPVDWDMYYYITPAYSLGSLQNRVELDNHVTGRLTRDFKNTQVWELTFADPMKILGPKRDLRVNTGEKKEIVEERNRNTANMQYKNVLFYKGAFMDYNGNLASVSGEYASERQGEREYHFWRVPTSEGPVYIGITHYPAADGGILEVGTEKQHAGYQAFQRDIKDNPSACRDTGLYTRYTSCRADQITYDHGKATANGKPWPLDGYDLYESPYVNSKHGSGVIDIAKGPRSLRLDFRVTDKPIRIEREERSTPGKPN